MVKKCFFLLVSMSLVACGGGETGALIPPPPTVDTPPISPPVAQVDYTVLETRAEASRFLIQAGFGGTDAQIDALVGTDAAEWVAQEMAKTPDYYLPEMQRRYPTRLDTDDRIADLVWENMVAGDDVLRQRMFFALSQIFVYNVTESFDRGYQAAYYTDVLTRNAFGDYRTLIEDVTYSVAMSNYLTYYRNRKANSVTGSEPDENYAREILQLFSIGLVELNADGAPKAGAPETYTNADIVGLARVFTGLAGKSATGSFNQSDEDYRHHPLQMFEAQHSEAEKQFLGTTIPAGTPGTQTIDTALDVIAAHPNVGPFLSRQLIQRFTASNPAPEYVARVAAAFDAGTYQAPNGRVFGAGQRGDMSAALAAVLLDETVHDDVDGGTEGKVREPVVKFIQHLRTFDVAPDRPFRLGITSRPSQLSQSPMRSPSVFNFYRPGYEKPVSATGDKNLTAPEFQIVHEGTTTGFLNFVSDFVFKRVGGTAIHAPFVPDFAKEIAIADDPAGLVDNLNIKLTAGSLSDTERQEIVETVALIPIETDTADADRLQRVQIAVYMILGSSAFSVQN